MAPLYQRLHSKLDILVYSGGRRTRCCRTITNLCIIHIVLFIDSDSCVPFLGTQRNMDLLGLPVKASCFLCAGNTRSWSPLQTAWAQWLVDGQVGGFYRSYSSPKMLAFATVRGSGHMVPMYTPKEALELLKQYLNRDFAPSRQ